MNKKLFSLCVYGFATGWAIMDIYNLPAVQAFLARGENYTPPPKFFEKDSDTDNTLDDVS